MIQRLCAALLVVLLPNDALAQSVPESIHSESSGPVEMCGLIASDILELRRMALASDGLEAVPVPTPRFELFTSADQYDQLIFTTASEPAYPAATCRHLYEQDGTLRMSRQMTCDAGRAECDALFLEFQELDASFTRALRTGN